MTPLEVINLYYASSPALRALLLTHSECVAGKALACAHDRGVECDLDFVREAAMLHDIGIINTDAPGILCHGSLPYICHGIEGRRMLEAIGLPRHAMVCERHTGAGLTIADIEAQKLPLPHRDMCPVTVEEQLICYADKFYSKSGDPTAEKPLDRVLRSMERHGNDTLARFLEMHRRFGHI
ncbi:MAG: HDIG domain-containing protein [Muribaculaceae bacterium]|nr:HDIG domain-containing protein [Muribaculaceae bacterium]